MMTTHANPLQATVPPTILWNGEHLAAVKKSYAAGDKTYATEVKGVISKADHQLTHASYTITTRERPAGTNYDRHDYFSMGPYWWPDPAKGNGVPYIRRDGEVNPNSYYCRKDLEDFIGAARDLSLAYYLTGDERYATKAAFFVRAWFIDAATRMNPNMNHAQAVPGRNEGRGIGLIDTAKLRELIDSLQLLSLSPSWPQEDQAAVKAWFTEFLHWFLESKQGQDESREKNNHGTWYHQQVMLYAAFVGKDELAKPFFDSRLDTLITNQVEPDGRQPLELARTRAMMYCSFNLMAWADIATLSRRAGKDYWNVSTPIGKRIKAGIDFLAPYADPKSKWVQDKVERDHYFALLSQASVHFGGPSYKEAIRLLPRSEDKYPWRRLVYPEAP